MLLRPTLITLLTILSFGLTFGQDTWSLEKCIEYAQKNSLSVKQAQYGIKSAELTNKQAKYERHPSASFNTSVGYQFGRTINPITNTFDTERIGFNQSSFNANVTLYAGNQINNGIKQSGLDLEASKLDADFAANTIALNVAAAYLNILLSEEQLENAKKSLEQTQAQLEQTDKLIRAGSLPKNDRLDFVAQIALNEQTIIEAENQVAINYLNLKQLMTLDPKEEIRVERPEFTVPAYADPEAYSLNSIYGTALGTQPQIKAGDLRLESAQLGEAIAKGAALPTVSLFGNLNANYSSAFQDFDNADDSNAQLVPQNRSRPVLVNGQEALVTEFELIGVVVPNKPFFDQLNETFGQSVGISVNVPIYSRGRNRINAEQARIGVLNQEVTNEQNRQQLKTDVQRAIADARAAQESLKASERSLEAAQIAFDNAQRRFDLGTINTLEFTTAQNNLDQAQLNLTQAKYSYLFFVKTVEFYQGKTLTLN